MEESLNRRKFWESTRSPAEVWDEVNNVGLRYEAEEIKVTDSLIVYKILVPGRSRTNTSLLIYVFHRFGVTTRFDVIFIKG